MWTVCGDRGKSFRPGLKKPVLSIPPPYRNVGPVFRRISVSGQGCRIHLLSVRSFCDCLRPGICACPRVSTVCGTVLRTGCPGGPFKGLSCQTFPCGCCGRGRHRDPGRLDRLSGCGLFPRACAHLRRRYLQLPPADGFERSQRRYSSWVRASSSFSIVWIRSPCLTLTSRPTLRRQRRC